MSFIASPVPRRLSVELIELSQTFEHADIRLGKLMFRLKGRAYTLFLVLLSLPFCQPLALPGLSTPFGVVIALLGLRFALRQKPWLPKKLRNVRLPAKVLTKVLRIGGKVLAGLEKLLHPRMSGIFDYRITQFLAGLAIFLSGLLLLLPLPIPFSNLLPALAVLLVSVSVSERDGVMLGAGALAFCVTLVFFAGICVGGAEVAGWLEEQFGGMFDPDDEAGAIQPPGHPLPQ